MPPSSGYRAERSLTASPWGRKKNSPARTQSVMELGPAAAAVANQRRLTTATTLNSTMSRRSSARGSVGWSIAGAAVAVMSDSALEVEAIGVEDVAQQVKLLIRRGGDFRKGGPPPQWPADAGAHLVSSNARIERRQHQLSGRQIGLEYGLV